MEAGGAAGPQAPSPGSHAAEVLGSSGSAQDGESWGCGEAVGWKSLPAFLPPSYFPAEGQLVLFS